MKGWTYQAVGSLCVECNYRKARPHAQNPNRATLYCSDRCRVAAGTRRYNDRTRDLTEQVRSMLGLPCGKGKALTPPELEAIVRRLRRVLPYEGLAMHPPRHRRTA